MDLRVYIILAIIVLSKSNIDAAQTESFAVHTSITARFSETVITSKVRNEKKTSDEVEFQVILPKEAFISGFSMSIADKAYDAAVEEKAEARRQFVAAQAQNRTAGLVETRGRGSTSGKTFKTSVNIEAEETVEFELKYQQLLRRVRGKFRSQIILLGSQLTQYLTIRVDICEKEEIQNIEVPPVLDSAGKSVLVKTAIDKQRNSARVDYLQGQNEAAIVALSSGGGSFVVEYELASTPDEGQVVLSDGYVAFFYAPDIKTTRRRIVFTLDVSGSMQGDKLSQMQTAMSNIIGKLTPNDRFTLVIFHSQSFLWKNARSLHAATPENIKEAQSFISAIQAQASTNIYRALQLSLDVINADIANTDDNEDGMASYIVFLTDGIPTAGEIQTPEDILSAVNTDNINKVLIHAIGFGTGVDADFLESLAVKNNGTWTQIFENINAALQIQNYLDELSVSVPLLQDIEVKYPTDIFDAFIVPISPSRGSGGEYFGLGRVRKDITNEQRGAFVVTISSESNGEAYVESQFSMGDKPLSCQGIDKDTMKNFGTKAFALSSVMESLRLYAAERNAAGIERLKREAIQKSIEAGIVTPVTSLLVIKPENKRRVRRDVRREQGTTTQVHSQKRISSSFCHPEHLTSDICFPYDHFVIASRFYIRMSESTTACFNWLGSSGEVYNLLNDPSRSIVVNGLMQARQGKNQKRMQPLFISKLLIALAGERVILKVDSREVLLQDTSINAANVNELHFPLTEHEYETSYGRIKFSVSDVSAAHALLNITVDEDISFIIIIHHPATDRSKDFDHLDLMIHTGQKPLHDIGGLYGLFPTRQSEQTDVARIQTSSRQSYLQFRDQLTPVSQTTVVVPYLKRKLFCWHTANPESILLSPLPTFRVKGLYDLLQMTY